MFRRCKQIAEGVEETEVISTKRLPPWRNFNHDHFTWGQLSAIHAVATAKATLSIALAIQFIGKSPGIHSLLHGNNSSGPIVCPRPFEEGV